MYQQDLQLLRGTRLETLAIVGRLSQAESDRAPDRGGWSVGENLDHLLLAENIYRTTISDLIHLAIDGKRPVITEGFDRVNTSLSFLPQAAMPLLETPMTVFNLFVPGFVREAMTEFRIISVGRPDIARPALGKPIGEMKEELKQSFNSTRLLFESNPTLDFRRMRYRHPMMGDNHALALLRILAFHERRHQSQIRDILKERPAATGATA